MVSSRKLEDLDPDAASVCQEHLRLCRDAGIELIVTSTWRDFEAQDQLYAIGRTVEKERRPVTNARGGKSWHNYKAAYDVVGVISGKPVWDAKDPIWKEIIRFGKEAGAEAGADWKTFPDFPHFQFLPKISRVSIDFAEAFIRFKEYGTIFTA
jgi:peptidoglycan L-alanyl-D-glutamate endopeptidase CwlK